MLGGLSSTLITAMFSLALPILLHQYHLTGVLSSLSLILFLTFSTSLQPVAGSIADRRGPVHVWRIGSLFFLVGSLLPLVAPSYLAVLAARALQGAATAFFVPATFMAGLSIGQHRGTGRAVASTGAFLGVGSLVGPLLGGLLLSLFSWPSIFLFGALTAAVALYPWRAPQPKEPPAVRPADLKGALLLVAAIAVLTALEVLWHKLGWWAAPMAACGVLLCLWFGRHEQHTEDPLMDLDWLRTERLATALAIVGQAAVFTLPVLIPFLMTAAGVAVWLSGLSLALLAGLRVVAQALAGPLSDRRGIPPVGLLAMSLLGLGALAALTAQPSDWPLLVAAPVLAGLGIGLNQPLLQIYFLESSSRGRGEILGFFGVVRGFGNILGALILGVTLPSYGMLTLDHLRFSFLSTAVCAVIALVLFALLLVSGAAHPARSPDAP